MDPFFNDFRSYIGISLAAELFHLCKGKQFEPMHDGDFVNFINLRPTLNQVKIKVGEKTRLSYFIYILSKEIVDPYCSDYWESKMLEQCNIEKKHYEKHRCDIISKENKANKNFRESLQKAISDAVKFDSAL